MLISSLKSLATSSIKTFLLVAVTFSLASCASISGSESNLLVDGEIYTQDFPEVSENTLAINSEQDRFRVGDTADIFVFNVESITNTYPVDRAGNINFPLIGTQKVAGLTTLDLQQELIAAYGENYLQNPSITVKRETNELGNMVVDGAVSKPGVFELYKPVRLSEAVALAGGLSDVANSKEIYIVREIEGKKKVKTVNLKNIRQFGAPDPQIYPEDIVYIPDSANKSAYNEFLRALPILSTFSILAIRR